LKSLILVLMTVAVTTAGFGEDPVSGYLVYTDGTYSRFLDLTKIEGIEYNYAADLGTKRIHRLTDDKEILLFFDNQNRWVPLSELDYLEIGKHEFAPRDAIRARVDFRLKNGVTVRCDLELRYLVNITIEDEEGGEPTTHTTMTFAKQEELRILRVVFD